MPPHSSSTETDAADGHPPAAADPRAPLWATFALTWVNNIGASVALMGVYFIASAAYEFTKVQCLLLGLVLGVTYIAGAMTAGPLGRKLAGPGKALSTRALTGVVMLLMGLTCWLPVVWRDPWSLWLVVLIYSPLSGWLWPLIESFMASGRSGEELRHATGTFNFSWSSCQSVVFLLVLPVFMPSIPAGTKVSQEQLNLALWSMPLLALSHAAAMIFLAQLPREPGAHHESTDESLTPDRREQYKRLLTASRWLIIMGYVSFSTTNPLLPDRLSELGVSIKWQTAVVSTWMIARVLMFAFMARWHGWQGKRRTLIWSGSLLLVGVTGMLLAPNTALMGISLALFGLGHGAIYSAAFYYAMEVGSAGVDAGGKHEALIGCGYTVGPLAAIAAKSIMDGREAGLFTFERVLACAVIALAGVAGVLAWRAVRRPPPH
jgi:hypothetical protein